MYIHVHLYSGLLIKTYYNLETLLFAERGKLKNSQKSHKYYVRKNAMAQQQVYSQTRMTRKSGKKEMKFMPHWITAVNSHRDNTVEYYTFRLYSGRSAC